MNENKDILMDGLNLTAADSYTLNKKALKIFRARKASGEGFEAIIYVRKNKERFPKM